MGMATGNAWLVILLGMASTTQIHLAKALDRQGVETLDLVRARLQRAPEPSAGPREVKGRARMPVIYAAGLVLNHTAFVYSLFVAPIGGTTALYTSMFGMGLIALLVYSNRVMKEAISRMELAGAVAILAGTVIIGVEGIGRPPLDMGRMELGATVGAVVLLLGMCGLLLVVARRQRSLVLLALAFGLCAGTCGSLDPFLKAVGQTAGGGNRLTPETAAGWVVLASSFLVGEAAVLVTQWGFYRRARANVLVPAYNCSYIGIPVVLQALLLPGYRLYWTTVVGVGLIVAGFVLMRGLARSGAKERASQGLP